MPYVVWTKKGFPIPSFWKLGSISAGLLSSNRDIIKLIASICNSHRISKLPNDPTKLKNEVPAELDELVWLCLIKSLISHSRGKFSRSPKIRSQSFFIGLSAEILIKDRFRNHEPKILRDFLPRGHIPNMAFLQCLSYVNVYSRLWANGTPLSDGPLQAHSRLFPIFNGLSKVDCGIWLRPQGLKPNFEAAVPSCWWVWAQFKQDTFTKNLIWF